MGSETAVTLLEADCSLVGGKDTQSSMSNMEDRSIDASL